MPDMPPQIAILLASYQGARHIAAQLDSLAAQDYRHWRLVVSDDGSTDDTIGIVRGFAAAHPGHEVTIVDGPREGATRNFLSLIAAVRPGEALAYCDQDDVWLPDRLSRGVRAIEAVAAGDRPPGIDAVGDDSPPAGPQPTGMAPGNVARAPPDVPPAGAGSFACPPVFAETLPAGDSLRAGVAPPAADAVHASSGTSAAATPPPGARAVLHVTRTTICDSDLRPLRPAPLYRRPPGFRNALIQACTPGNTTLVNPAGVAILRAGAEAAARADIVSHDWWTYQLISGAEGLVIRDPAQTVLYRQHRGNVMGRNDTPRAMLARISRLGAGHYGDWLRSNLVALEGARALLTPENRAVLDGFAAALRAPGPRAATELARLGLYRQTVAGTAAFYAAAAMGRLGPRR